MEDSNSKKTLAIFGDEPYFEEPVHVNRPTTPDKERLYKLLDNIIATDRYTNDGPYVNKLERKIENYLDVRNCVLVANGTLALQLLVNALELKGEIILPAFTFIATASAVNWQGLYPVFCDIDLNTYNLSADHCRHLISQDTAAILGVHLWGQACDIEMLSKLTRENGIPLLYDAAHAFSSEYRGRKIGAFGDAEVFSFHATKLFHTVEGGAITTNNDELANILRMKRNFGFVDYDKTGCLGINCKLSELHAAVGLVNFEMLDANLKKARIVHQRYASLLSNNKYIHLIQYDENSNHHYVVVRVADGSPLSRDQLHQVLLSENIQARKHFYPGCQNLLPFRNYENKAMLRNTDIASESCLVLPGGANIKTESVDKVCEVIDMAFSYSEKIADLLR